MITQAGGGSRRRRGGGGHEYHICHILPPSEIDLGLCFGCFLQAREGNMYFAELAERVEYGNYEY